MKRKTNGNIGKMFGRFCIVFQMDNAKEI